MDPQPSLHHNPTTQPEYRTVSASAPVTVLLSQAVPMTLAHGHDRASVSDVEPRRSSRSARSPVCLNSIPQPCIPADRAWHAGVELSPPVTQRQARRRQVRCPVDPIPGRSEPPWRTSLRDGEHFAATTVRSIRLLRIHPAWRKQTARPGSPSTSRTDQSRTCRRSGEADVSSISRDTTFPPCPSRAPYAPLWCPSLSAAKPQVRAFLASMGSLPADVPRLAHESHASTRP